MTAARARRWLLALYLGSAALVTLQQAVLGRSNNFRVFRSASLNLFAGRDLYAAHPEQHFDFYKYSPLTFVHAAAESGYSAAHLRRLFPARKTVPRGSLPRKRTRLPLPHGEPDLAAMILRRAGRSSG